MQIKKWITNKIAGLSLALSNVEKNIFTQNGDALSNEVSYVKRHTEGQLADSLINGEVTNEVMNLRWRMYKILKHSDGLITTINGLDKDGLPIVKTRKANKNFLKQIKVDTFDTYPLELVIDNTEIYLSTNEIFEGKYLNTENPTTNDSGSYTHGEIKSDDYFATHKTDNPIQINRETVPKFKIEKYTKKLNIRKIDDTKRLLEFYVSMYPDEFNRSTRLFISEVKKQINNQMLSSTFELKDVSFITYKSIGAIDFMEYKYEITSFDKIIEFNGHFVIKFNANILIDGNDILNIYKMWDLDEKYDKKEKRIIK